MDRKRSIPDGDTAAGPEQTTGRPSRENVLRASTASTSGDHRYTTSPPVDDGSPRDEYDLLVRKLDRRYPPAPTVDARARNDASIHDVTAELAKHPTLQPLLDAPAQVFQLALKYGRTVGETIEILRQFAAKRSALGGVTRAFSLSLLSVLEGFFAAYRPPSPIPPSPDRCDGSGHPGTLEPLDDELDVAPSVVVTIECPRCDAKFNSAELGIPGLIPEHDAIADFASPAPARCARALHLVARRKFGPSRVLQALLVDPSPEACAERSAMEAFAHASDLHLRGDDRMRPFAFEALRALMRALSPELHEAALSVLALHRKAREALGLWSDVHAGCRGCP
jgi:hypothetical protein